MEATKPDTVGELEVRRPERASMFQSLQHRDFRLLMFGILLANGGIHLRSVATGWLVYDLTKSAFLLGLVGTATALPMLFLAPLTGVVVDRMDRKKLLTYSHSLGLIAMVSLATLILAGRVEVWHVFVFVLVYGTLQAFYVPARQVLVTELVDKDNFMNAIALTSATNQISRILGPTIAGGLLLVGGIAACFYFAGFTYGAIIVPLFLISVRSLPAADTSATIWQNLKEGLRYVAGNRTMLILLAMEAVPAIFGWQYVTLMPVFAGEEVLNVGASGYAWLMAASGAGSLAGALTLAALGNFRRKGLLLLLSAIAFGLLLIVFALSPWFPTSLLILVFVGWASAMYASLTNTLIQLLVPNELRGRMMSFYMLALNGMTPLGSLQAGTLASTLGAPASLMIGGTIVATFSLAIMVFVPRLRQL
ncbi:MAG: MFS transporter [Chloroflexi bacterium]|nr:MFS transporter [Chloroflexota bacterium]